MQLQKENVKILALVLDSLMHYKTTLVESPEPK